MSRADVKSQMTPAHAQAAALKEAMTQIAARNADPLLNGLIADALVQCEALHRLLANMSVKGGGVDDAVDLRVFERLMSLAGPVTARELLDQLLVDLRNVENMMTMASSQLDFKGIRGQCHILVAIAGSVGARSLQREAERLQDIAVRSDGNAVAETTPALLAKLATLITFAAAERSSRAAQ